MRRFSEWLNNMVEADGSNEYKTDVYLSNNGGSFYTVVKDAKDFMSSWKTNSMFMGYANMDDLMNDPMVSYYGKYLVKFGVDSLDNFLVLDKQLAQKLRGGMNVEEQVEAAGMKYPLNLMNRLQEIYDSGESGGVYLQDFAYEKKCRGLVLRYNGAVAVVLYPPYKGVAIKKVTDLTTHDEMKL